MKRLFLWIFLLVALVAGGVYGVVLLATARAAEDVFHQLTSVYDEVHELLPADPDAFPGVPREGYTMVGAELSEMGFRRLGSMEDRTVSEALPAMRTYLDVYTNATGDIFCATYRVQTPEIEQQIVDFESQFEDGTFLATTNSLAAAWMTPAPQIDTEIMDAYASTGRISMRHRERLAEARERGRLTKTVSSLEEVLQTQRAFSAFEVEHRQSVGYMTYDELLAMSGQDRGDVYLPGALRFLHWVFKRHVKEHVN